MEDIHLSRELLLVLENGQGLNGALTELTPKHLPSECAHCRAEINAFQIQRRGRGEHPILFAEILSSLLEHILTLGAREVPRAERDLHSLLPLTPSQRRGRFGYSRGRFRSGALARLLLDESWYCLPSSPTEAFEFARLATMILAVNSHLLDYFDLMSLAEAYMASACCLTNDYRSAAYYFAIARDIILEQGVTDPEVVGRVDALMSSLREFEGLEEKNLLERARLQFKLNSLERPSIPPI